jgi:hypothetical protein
MSLHRLATIELQLVMQHCDAQSLLALARCSRFTLEAASDSFAWRALSPLPLPFSFLPNPVSEEYGWAGWRWLCCCCCSRRPHAPPAAPTLSVLVSGSLLRFCDIGVNWRDGAAHCPGPVTDAELDALAATPRLCALSTVGRLGVSGPRLDSLLRRPGLRGLTALSCTAAQLSPAVLAGCCPRLCRLTLWAAGRTEPGAFAGRAHAVPPLGLERLPALTALAFVGGAHRDISLCRGLLRLEFSGVAPRAVLAVLAAPAGLAALRHLTVAGINASRADGCSRPPAPVDWAAAFQNLLALRSLDLEDVRAPAALLSAACLYCARLEQLRVRCAWPADPSALVCAVDSVAPLAELLGLLPALRSVDLSLVPLDQHTHGVRSLPADLAARTTDWSHVRGELAAVASLHADRVSLRLE